MLYSANVTSISKRTLQLSPRRGYHRAYQLNFMKIENRTSSASWTSVHNFMHESLSRKNEKVKHFIKWDQFQVLLLIRNSIKNLFSNQNFNLFHNILSNFKITII